MRISDWSSDVCSSDLNECRVTSSSAHCADDRKEEVERMRQAVTAWARQSAELRALVDAVETERNFYFGFDRSEERRVGKACVRKCRSRWSPYQLKTNKVKRR